MEHNAFRDYCKAENSDDEEDNHDLQSRLYAEIYYASNNVESVDTKLNIKLEIPSVDSNEFHKDTHANKTSEFNDSFGKNQFSESQTKTSMTNDVMSNSLITVKDDKSCVKPISTINEPGTSYTDDKNTLHIPCVDISENSQENIECSKDKNNPDPQNIHNASTDVLIKPEVEVDSKEELRSVQGSNFESTTVIQSDLVIPKECNVDSNVENIQNNGCIEPKEEDSCNILKKYDFAKLFINNLYLKKYENLNKRLQELDEEKETNMKEKEQARVQVEENENVHQGEQSDTEVGSTDETTKDTRYNVLTRSEKLQGISNDSEEITLLSSDMDSDSEVSILEVPIPPKPQPPVINVQDSDDNLEISSSDNEREYWVSLKNKYVSPKKNERGSYTNKKNTLPTHMTEDIMLNCTKVQKGASSIQEIIETSKNVQNKPEPCSSKDKPFCAKDTSSSVTEIHGKNLSRTDKSLMFVNDKNKSDVQLQSETINNSNAVYERDKTKSVSFARDVNFDNICESSSSRKRHCEDDSGPSNIKQRKTADDENRHREINSKQHENRDKSKEETWEEYFFRPMPDRLKAFYNESRGQENFDIQEIQSKMSKDPRLWAILDEDLMPSFSKRHRFWNVKCNNCRQEGHQAYNCTQPRKPPQCYMCGTPGHTETRCPQKMCLTCGKKQGTFRKTCESCRTLHCQMCESIGHVSNECPDHWRRFHQTTHNSEINIPDNLSEIMKPADLLYCCNCTKRGHDSYKCHEYRWSQHFPTPAYVTNYMDESGAKDTMETNTHENDMIPLSRKTYNKGATIKHSSFSQGKNDMLGCRVLFTYGHFEMKKGDSEEIVRKFTHEGSGFTRLLNNGVSTSILDQLSKIVNFEIKIFRNPENTKMIRVRTASNVAEHVYEFFLYWLKLQDEDKQLHLQTDLPRSSKNILRFLTTRWEELQQNVHDPKFLHNQIKELKMLADNIQDRTTCNTSSKILDLRSNLLKVLHTQPKLSKLATRLQKMMGRLQKMAKSITDKIIKLPMFVDIIVIYNKLFLPRALTTNEFHQLLEHCNEKDETNKGKENEKSKKQKKKCNPYETFLQNLQNFNQANASEQHRQKPTDINDDTTRSTIVTQKQDKQLPTTSKCSVTNNITSSNNSGTKSNIENDHTKTSKKDTAKHNNVYPAQVVQLQHNQNMPSETLVRSNVKTFDKISVSHITPPKKPTCPDTFSKHVQNDYLSSVPCTEVRSVGNVEKRTGIIIDTGKIRKASTSQQEGNIGTGPPKKKKCRRLNKSRWNSTEPNPKVTVDQSSNSSKFLVNNAASVINEALTFDLPYMNKAVAEVRKRIVDKNIKQEHIDVLQRLINLEKDHRQYVNAFCSYLK